MAKIFTSVDNLYHLIAGTQSTRKGDEMNKQQEETSTNIISQLCYIESRTNYLIEIREFLTNGLRNKDYVQGGIDPSLIPPSKMQKCI